MTLKHYLGQFCRDTSHPLQARGRDALGTKHVLAGSYSAGWPDTFLREGPVPYGLDTYCQNNPGYYGKGLSVLSGSVPVCR